MRKRTAKNHCYVIWCFSASSIGQISAIFLSYTPLSPEPTTKKHFSITFLPFSALFGTFLLRFTRFAIRSSACNTFHFRFHSVYFRYSSNFRCVCVFFLLIFPQCRETNFSCKQRRFGCTLEVIGCGYFLVSPSTKSDLPIK